MNNDLRHQKILFCLGALEIGGAEKQALMLARYLMDKHQADVQVLGLGSPGSLTALLDEAGIRWRVVPYRWHSFLLVYFLFLLRYFSFFWRERPDIIISYTLIPNIIGALFWRFCGVKCFVWNQRDEGIESVHPWVMKLAVKLTSCFVANSAGAAAYLTEQWQVSSSQVYQIFNGLSMQGSGCSRDQWRERLGVSADTFVAVMAANLSSKKDHLNLIRAWARVQAYFDSYGKSCLLVLAGRHDDQIGVIEALRDQLSLSSVLMPGFVDDIQGLFGAADLAVFSSVSEGSPNGVIEAMASGLAVVATDIPAIRQILAVSNQTYLAPVGDAETLAQSIIVLAADLDLRHQIGRENQAAAEALFSSERNFAQVEAVIRQYYRDRTVRSYLMALFSRLISDGGWRMLDQWSQWVDLRYEWVVNRLHLVAPLAKSVKPRFKIGFAVLAHNRPEYLRICLDSLFRTRLYDYDVTFLIHDDGSNDPRVRLIIDQEREPHYQIVRHYAPKGHASWGAAFNSAIKVLMDLDDFDILGTCDSDAVFHPEWLDKTLKVALWAKAHHRDHVLGPFSSYNSANYQFHHILGIYDSPYGQYVVKERMGAVNYLYFKEDLLKLGFFEAHRDDETLMTERFRQLRVRNFCTEISYVEHIGNESVLNQWRPTAVDKTDFGLHLADGNWGVDLCPFRLQPLFYYLNLERDYQSQFYARQGREFGLDVIFDYLRGIKKELYWAYFDEFQIEPSFNRLKRIFYLWAYRYLLGVPYLRSRDLSSTLLIDVVIPAIDKDAAVLPYVIDSIRVNIRHPIGQIYVVSHPGCARVVRLCEEKAVRFIDETTILPITKADIDYSYQGLDRSGWLFQQLLKLSADQFCENEHILVCDADTVFIRPQVFEYRGKMIFDLSDEYHPAYFRTYEGLTGLERCFPLSFVSHHMMFTKTVLRELKRHIESVHHQVWWQAIISETDMSDISGFSEYETYGNFMFYYYCDCMRLEYFRNLGVKQSDIRQISELILQHRDRLKSLSFHDYY